MSKEKMILSEGFEGDRHVMTFEEAKQEVYDIALNDNEESQVYMEDYPGKTIIDFAEFIKDCFDKDIKNGYCHECFGVKYQILNDENIEKLWRELTDITFDDSENDLVLSEDWFIFDEGTEREDIWHWFDHHHSKGIGWLMNEYEK